MKVTKCWKVCLNAQLYRATQTLEGIYPEVKYQCTDSGCKLTSNLDFDSSYDDSFLGLNKPKTKSENMTTIEDSASGLFYTDEGRVMKNLDHVIFEDMPKMMNGIRFLSLNHPHDVIDEMDVFKMRIANPVCSH